jgi:hypothetical protein
MKAFLDERILPVARPTVAGALEAARAAAQAGGRIVVEVLIDGQPAPGHLIDNPSEVHHRRPACLGAPEL